MKKNIYQCIYVCTTKLKEKTIVLFIIIIVMEKYYP